MIMMIMIIVYIITTIVEIIVRYMYIHTCINIYVCILLNSLEIKSFEGLGSLGATSKILKTDFAELQTK
jgi:hypothetical protein